MAIINVIPETIFMQHVPIQAAARSASIYVENTPVLSNFNISQALKTPSQTGNRALITIPILKRVGE